jgi:hypothetical protein
MKNIGAPAMKLVFINVRNAVDAKLRKAEMPKAESGNLESAPASAD